MSKEQHATKIYNHILKDVTYRLVGDETTYLDELNGAGKVLLGVKFKGVFPSDKIPKLNDLATYCICNLDTSSQPGSHWVALAKDGNITYVYDSFGRSHTSIFPNVLFSGNGRIVDVDRDAEQHVLETDCGARCLAFLCVFEFWGANVAKLV